MEPLKIYLSCEDNETLRSWTKKIYLLEADKRLGLNIFHDISEAGTAPVDNILHIQPCPNTDRRGTKWTGLWHIDCADESFLANRYANFDTVFLASSSALRKGDNTQLLFQASDPIIQKRLPSIEQDHDFVLCGSMDAIDRYNERRRRTEIMKTKFSYYDFGKGYPPKEFIQNYNHAKVQWIQSALSPEPYRQGMCAQRFFECIAIGPVLCNWCEDLALTGLIEDVDYMCYRTDEEMVEKMERLLSDEKLRNTIAENGRRKSFMYHTYDQRTAAIISTVRKFDHD